MVIHTRHKRKRHLGTIKTLSFVIFLVSLALAYIDTIWAIYINEFVNNASIVGALSSLFVIFSIFLYFYFIPLLEKHHPTKIYLFSLMLYAVAYVLFAISSNFYLFVVLGFMLTIASVLRKDSMGVIIRDESKLTELGRNEGIIYAVSNISWLIGPLIASFLSQKFNISLIFLLAATSVAMAIITFRTAKVHEKVIIPRKVDKNLFKNIKDFFSSRELTKTYLVSGGIDLWWAILYLYVPLFMIKEGLNLTWVGIFLFAVCVPLTALEYFVGKRADKYGFKKFFIAGYTILAIMSIIAFALTNIYWILLVLVLASIGAAFLEPTTEAYFFKLIPKAKENKYYGPFCTASDFNSLIGLLIAAGVLFFLPFKYIFLLLAIQMTFFALVALKLKKN